MTTTVKQRVTVDADGAVRVQSDQLRPGDEAEVIVSVTRHDADAGGKDETIPPDESAYDAFVRLGLLDTIGKYDDPNIPSDLSANPKYMEDFGKDPGEAASRG